MQAKLLVVDGEAKAPQFDVQLPAVIGRSRNSDVILGHRLISRRHCEVFESDGLLMLRDLGSLNGTFVGQTRLAEQAMPLAPGEQFSVGPVTFQADYQAPDHGAEADRWDAAEQPADLPPDPGE